MIQTGRISAWTQVWHRGATMAVVSRDKLQQIIEQEMHVPTTLDMLFHAEPSAARQNRSWSGVVESVSRCVVAHQRPFTAAEHSACSRIQTDICGHASTLKRLLSCNVDSTQFLTLLHRFIMNRSFKMALREVINRPIASRRLFGLSNQSTPNRARQTNSC